LRTQFSQRGDDGSGHFQQRVFIQAGFAHDEAEFVIVDNQNPAAFYGLNQIVFVPHRQRLPGIQNVIDAFGFAGTRILYHVVEIAGRDDDDCFPGVEFVKIDLTLVFHCAGIEPGNLIIGPVGGNVGTGSKLLIDDFDAFRGDAVLLKPLEVFLVIVADGGTDDGMFAEHSQSVSNVAGRAAEFFLHAVYLKADIEHVDFIRQNMVGKIAGKIHDSVIRH